MPEETIVPDAETTAPVAEQTATEAQTKTPEEGEAEFNKRGNNSVKALKFYAELILSLPDDVMPLDDKKLDELLEPRSQELYDKIKESGLTMDEVEIGFTRINEIIMGNTGKRIMNYLKIVMQTINEAFTGFPEPQKEMPLAQLVLLAQKTKEIPAE